MVGSVETLRATHGVSLAARRSVLGTLAGIAIVIAVIAGVLAMHALSLEGPEIGVATSVGAEQASAPLPEQAAPFTAGLSILSCDRTVCQPGHSMSVAVCVLALLFVSFLLAVLDRARWREPNLLTRLMRSMHIPRALRHGTEPSLVVLSVSRT